MSDKEYWRGYVAARLQNAATENALRQRAEQAEARVAKLEGVLWQTFEALEAVWGEGKTSFPETVFCTIQAARTALSAPGQPEGER